MSSESQAEPAAIAGMRLYSVALLDIIHARKGEGAALLTRYAGGLRVADGCIRAELIRQLSPNDNHFALFSV